MSASQRSGLTLLLAAAVGCASGGDTSLDLLRYQRALETALGDPAAGWDGCTTVSDPGLRGDCRMAVVETWAGFKTATTQDLLARCDQLEPTWMAHECAFQVGERRDDADACGRAGDFADDCRLHLATATFDAWMPKDARVDDPGLHGRMIAEAEAAGLAGEDPRVWSAFFRRVLAQQPSVDRRTCRALTSPLDEACLSTGRQHYLDRLNMARDRGLYPCDGGPLPSFLRVIEDTELELLRARREQNDLCPERHAP